MRLTLPSALLLVPSVLGACSWAPWNDPAPAVASDERIGAPADVVWNALPRVYGFLGLQPISDADRTSLSVVSERTLRVNGSIVGPSDAPMARCSVPPTAQRTNNGGNLRFRTVNGLARVHVQTWLFEEGESTIARTEVTVSIDAATADPLQTRSGLCTTTGRLENQIAEGLRSLVSPPDSFTTPMDDRGGSSRGPF